MKELLILIALFFSFIRLSAQSDSIWPHEKL